MRAMEAVLVAVIVGLAAPVAGHESGCAQCNRNTTVGQTTGWALDAEAGRTPPGYSLTPGCCEWSRPCCDNAWAGYCEHRAKVDAFWSRVGGAKPTCRAAACRQAMPAACDPCPCCVMQSAPTATPDAVSPAPTPAAPMKAGERLRDPRLR
jgi:hypothetical protein